jgi:hypothetical protein
MAREMPTDLAESGISPTSRGARSMPVGSPFGHSSPWLPAIIQHIGQTAKRDTGSTGWHCPELKKRRSNPTDFSSISVASL